MKRTSLALLLVAAVMAGGCYGQKDFPSNPTCSKEYPQCPEGHTCSSIGLCVASSGATVSTFAGSTKGFQDGPAAKAKFNKPVDVVQSPGGGIFVADSDNHAIRLVRAGEVSTLTGNGSSGGKNGPRGDATFNVPYDLVVVSDSEIYVADRLNNVIRRVGKDSVNDYSNGTDIFKGPCGLDLGGGGLLYVADTGKHRVRVVKKGGAVDTLAGTGVAGSDDDDLLKASFDSPYDVEYTAGDLFVADTGNSCIRRISQGSKKVSTFAGKCGTAGKVDGSAKVKARFRRPYGIFMRQSRLYVADTDNNCIRVVSGGEVTTLAGECDSANRAMVNGPANEARFRGPRGLVVDSTGRVYVADTDNHLIRVISP